MNRRKTVALTLALAFLLAACEAGPTGTPRSSTPSPTSTTPSPSPPVGGLPISAFSFGRLPAVPLLTDAPAYAGPNTPKTLSEVRNPEMFAWMMTPLARKHLAHDGFVVVPGDASDKLMFAAYTEAPYGNFPVFVTTDVAYHQWHLTFDKLLRSVEQEVLLPKLERLTRETLAAARQQVAELRGTPLAAEAKRVLQLFQVEASVLGIPGGNLGSAAQEELALIRAHDGIHVSPILGFGGTYVPGTVVSGQIDYSLYTPRGHYTRTPELTRYFVGMSVLGQSAFLVTDEEDLRPFGMAVLASRLIDPSGLGTREVAGLWRDLYEPTAFLVGAADDYTPFETAAAVEATVPGAMHAPASLTNDDLADARSALLASRDVMVDPEAASIRLMGTRFVLDAYILDQLVDPNVDGRLIPSALDLAATFGSRFAYREQEKNGVTDLPHYDAKMNEMRELVAGRSHSAWGSTVYDGWLWSLEPSWKPHGDAFPDFMRTRAWTVKSHQTGFGSYAELRHDTILYVKQSSAEGEFQQPALTYRNWVEPDPVVYERLSAITGLMQRGLETRGLLTEEQTSLLDDTTSLLDFFARIARDELAGRPISRDDNRTLRYIGDRLEEMWLRTAERTGPPGDITPNDADDAVIADIARGFDEVLEIGTGRFDPVLVLVPDNQGKFEVAIGAVYSYYEFTQPVSNRLTDEAWRAMLNKDKAPDRPSWEQRILAG